MSDDRESGVDPRPERWLVPTDDDEQVDVPTTSRGRHWSPDEDDEQAGSASDGAAVVPPAAPEPAAPQPAGSEPAVSETAVPETTAYEPVLPATAAYRPVTPEPTAAEPATTVTPAAPDAPIWSGSHPASQDNADAAAWSAADDSATSAWQSDEAHTQLIQPVPVESAENTSILAAVAADQSAAGATRSPEGGRAARRAAERSATRPKTGGDRVRTVVRGIGQTFITLGVVVLLFVVYEVYITDIFSAAKQKEATAALDEKWLPGGVTEQTEVVTVTDPNQLVVDPASRARSYEVLDGEGFAKISIPAFGPDYHYTIISGTNPDELTTGPGHYPDSQYPGEQGNFAIAGHRVSKGSPFNALDQLNSCDAIIIETQDDWFVYRVLPMENEIAGWDPAARANCADVQAPTGQYAEANLYGREITLPTDYAQVLPVPHVDSYTVPTDAQRLITLTTCHPQFSDAERMIIHGTLVKTYTKSPGFIPPEMQEG